VLALHAIFGTGFRCFAALITSLLPLLPQSPNMGRKHDAVLVSEPVAEEAPYSPELDSEKKKKKKKNKNKDKQQESENSPKRKLDELDPQNGTESKKKKKKKHHDSKENVEETNGDRNNDNGANRDETVADGSVVVTGKNAGDAKYAAVKSFSDSGLPENVLECCKGFEKPSPIQSRAWPFLLDRRDLIGIAATGSGALLFVYVCVSRDLKSVLILVVFLSGKTLAFGIPAIMHVLGKRKGKGSRGRNPLCLVLSPTRELAQQVRSLNILNLNLNFILQSFHVCFLLLSCKFKLESYITSVEMRKIESLSSY